MRSRIPIIVTGAFALAVLMAFAPAASAQLDTGSIVGAVTDATGAVVSGASVTATQEGSGISVTTVTNQRGEYSIPNLRIGSYSVAAELQGFQRSVKQGLRLNIQTRLEVNLSLSIGAMTEEVIVEGGAEVLQTQTADMGYAVDERQLTDLPLLGRRYAELALLQTGVVEAGTGISGRGEDTFFNSNGNLATWNQYTLDGGDNNSFSTNLQERTPQVIQPPVDALEEFRIQTRTYSAEFGRSAGAIINASIKQGTNAVRGSVFGFFRDEALTATRFFTEQAGEEKGKFDQKIYGATLGGPIIKDKLYFFVDYQGERTQQAQDTFSSIPTARMRTGDLTELDRSLRDSPFAPGCVSGQIILPSCIDPVATTLLDILPQPNVAAEIAREGIPGGYRGGNYFSQGILDVEIDQFDIRLDTKLREGRDSVFVRYSWSDTNRNEPPALDDPIAAGSFDSLIDVRAMSGVLGWSAVWGNSVFSEVRAAWNNIDGDTFHHGFGTPPASSYGIKGIPEDPRYSGGIPFTQIDGFSRYGGPFFRPQFQESSVLQLSGNVSWNTGDHALKFGFERRRDQVVYLDLLGLNGFHRYRNGRYTNAGLGDFLLGLASQQRLTLFHEADIYTDGIGVFAQDTWRPSQNLTLNLGVRYEYFTPMQDKGNQMTNIDPATGEIFTSTDGGDIFSRALVHPDRNNIAPRISFNYQPSDRWVIKGGYGIFYQHTDRYGSESQMSLNPPQLLDTNIQANSRSAPPVFILREGFIPISPDDVDPAQIAWRIQDPNQDTPIVHQFSIGPEFRLTDNTTLSVEYVGNKIRNGRRLVDLNQGIVQPDGSVVDPYRQHGFGGAFLEQIRTDGRSDYNAVQAQLQKRFSDGFGFNASFTWSKTMSDFVDHLAGAAFPQNTHDVSSEYGRADFDIPKRFTLSFIYELPFGQGRSNELDGIGGAILNDWSVNGILTLSDGRAFSARGNDQSGTGSRRARPDCIGDPVPSNQTTDNWINPDAFADPADGTFGNCTLGTLRGPGLKTLNMSLFRGFPLGNDRRIEFRLEAFNVLNWVNYGLPGNRFGRGSFGRITRTLGSPREMQVALKLYF